MKHYSSIQFGFPGPVAPHAGAWIETGFVCGIIFIYAVAPHAGAWIETKVSLSYSASAKSPPTRGRGLKLVFQRGLA